MKLQKPLFATCLILLIVLSPVRVMAGDFDWLKELNITAINDPGGFRTRLAARFQIGDAQVNTVISNVAQPADAYMVLRMGELSGRPTDDILRTYQAEKNNGWGAMAKSLGIKPGSKAFHALKRGSDMANAENRSEHGKDKNKGHGNNKSSGKNKD